MNTYLIVSEINYYIKKKIADLTKDISNVITFDLDNASIDDVLEEASYFSMFNDMKCLIVHNSKIFAASKKEESKKNKEIIDKILKYLEHENRNTIIIFVTKNADSKKKIYKLINEANNLFVYKNMTRTEELQELKKIVNANGYKIDDTSLWFIINNTLGNFDIAYNELNKIMLYYSKKGNILYEDVVKLTSKSLEDNNFKLVDAIISKDLDKSLKLLNDFNILKGEPNIIISLLYREFKLMLSISIYEKHRYSYVDILKNLNLADWQYNKIKNNLYNYKIFEIKDEIKKLSILDYKFKSGLIDKDLILINYIVDLCV